MNEQAIELSNAFGYLKEKEVRLLYDIADKLPQIATIVNFGAGVGTSALAIAEKRPDLLHHLTTIDIENEINPCGGLGNERELFKRLGLPQHPMIHGSSYEVALTWDKPLDMVFIDGDHSVENERLDIIRWKKHVKKGGFIAIHDYSSEAWKDLKAMIDYEMSDCELYKLSETLISYIKK